MQDRISKSSNHKGPLIIGGNVQDPGCMFAPPVRTTDSFAPRSPQPEEVNQAEDQMPATVFVPLRARHHLLHV